MLSPRELVPWRRVVLETRLAPADAERVLAANVGEPRLFRRSELVFTGSRVAAYRFNLARTIEYKNPGLPVVDVEIRPREPTGARVHVTMRLHLLVAAFMTVWMTGALAGSILVIAAAIRRRDPVPLVVLLLPAVGVALIGGGFAVEARRTSALLLEIFPPPKDR